MKFKRIERKNWNEIEKNREKDGTAKEERDKKEYNNKEIGRQ